MKINLKALLITIVGAIVLYLSLYYIQNSFLKTAIIEQKELFDLSSLYFVLACVISVGLLEFLSVYASDKLALGFLVVMMVKLGAYMIIYTSGPELPKWMRLMLLAPLFLGLFIEVGYLYYRISETEKMLGK